MAKAVGLISGGLDSALALRLIIEQGIEVVALHIRTQFQAGKIKHPKLGWVSPSQALAYEAGVEYQEIEVGDEYLELIKNPPHGWGANLNPCLDCHAYFFRLAGDFMRKIGADFVFTGEVIGQRPMSQTKPFLRYVERASGLEGLLLRPLSAKLLPETEPEKKGIVDRERLLDISGRSRKRQLELADKLGLKYFSSPAGGCLLTDRKFSLRLANLLIHRHPQLPSPAEIEMLKLGRHFYFEDNTLYIVARNNSENQTLLELAKKAGLYALRPRAFPAPVVVIATKILGEVPSKEQIETAGAIMQTFGKTEKAVGTPQVCLISPSGNETVYPLPSQISLSREQLAKLRVDSEDKRLPRTPPLVK